MRLATNDDDETLAECLVQLAQHVASVSTGPYAAGLSATSFPDALKFVQHTLAKQAAGFALIEECDDLMVGCLLATIEQTSFTPSGLGDVGKIEAAWVAESHRGKGIGAQLVAEAERHFRYLDQDLAHVELSYLAGNAMAGEIWQRLGYQPFRIFASKQL